MPLIEHRVRARRHKDCSPQCQCHLRGAALVLQVLEEALPAELHQHVQDLIDVHLGLGNKR